MQVVEEPSKHVILGARLPEHSCEGAVAALRADGFAVTHIHLADISLLRTKISATPPDLVLLDLSSTNETALELLRQIRSSYEGPLVVLSDQGEVTQQILNLQFGADDILPVSVNPQLLATRVRALLRMIQRGKEPRASRLTLGALSLDTRRRETWFRDKSLCLTTVQFDLLWCLVCNAGRVMSREEIHRALHPTEYNGFDRGIDIHVCRIRRKLSDDSASPKYIKTVRGAGYLLVTPDF